METRLKMISQQHAGFHGKRSFLDVVMPVIEQKSDSKSLNRTINTTITLECQIRGQAGMEVTWKRDGQPLQGSSFEKNKTEYPQDLVISAVTKTQINVTYKNDRDIHGNFNCTGKRNNSRRLLCRSIYSCSASYPGATTSSQGDIPVTITPNIGNIGKIGNNNCTLYGSCSDFSY